MGFVFRVQGSGLVLRVEGSGSRFKVLDSGFIFSGSGLRVQGSGFRVWDFNQQMAVPFDRIPHV